MKTMPRAAVILIHDGHVALIERFRDGRRYYLFPGGGVEDGETLQEAAAREALEELGLEVTVGMHVAEVEYRNRTQHYFLADGVTGTFGTGQGPEMTEPTDPSAGTYTPVWVPVAQLLDRAIHPRCVAELTSASVDDGWPTSPVKLVDPDRGY